ncbi:50S ribosomal protein 5, chloroplastic [Juglans microcarpa x Juglans regia]|uniref:50S ribosomal protein 5, chloroplastic n=1 Tax=Juglans microcarpa x Juglans regia TaxID=2249226 RepID=UPI001B7DC17E|nr:50S ribosomal protein 5, chloroplastic [Juglans microcarpa x Juglans regia]
MALFLCSNPLTSISFSSSSFSSSFSHSSTASSSAFHITATSISRLHVKPIGLHPKCFKGTGVIKKMSSIVVNASSAIDATAGEPTSDSKEDAENKEEVVPVDKLPLESKLQERMEQKLKMKLAKKVRLRRNRLVRKRRLRKKGRWPPSKMKKLKNV